MTTSFKCDTRFTVVEMSSSTEARGAQLVKGNIIKLKTGQALVYFKNSPKGH